LLDALADTKRLAALDTRRADERVRLGQGESHDRLPSLAGDAPGLEWLLVEKDDRRFRVRPTDPGDTGWVIERDGDNEWVVSDATLQEHFHVIASLAVS
jgi:hypothetical protein